MLLLLYTQKSCPILCNSMDYSPPGSSVHGISQARILEWVAIPYSKGSSQLRDGTQVSCNGRQIFFLIFRIFIEVYLVYSVSGVQCSDSVLYIHRHIHIFFFRFFSLIGYYKILSIVACMCSRSLLVICFIYSNVYLWASLMAQW